MTPAVSSSGFQSLLKKLEVLRNSLRLASKLERRDIEKIQLQVKLIRDEVTRLSLSERYRDGRPTPKRKTKDLKRRREELLDGEFHFDGVFGESPAVLECLETIKRVAETDLPVLIIGESGTGKELLAEVVHANSPRANGPFVSVNCGAIPANLIETEFFGHTKGAFTGSVKERKGKFEAADGGTIFLDEIGELPLDGQVKLLRVLQSNEIQRVGSDDLIHVDTRIVAATNRDLHEMMKQEQFREDLFYRLSIIQEHLPPLRERRDEIPLLIDHFATEAASAMNRPKVKFRARLLRFLKRYEYPGNARQLRNIVYRLTCLADEYADLDELPGYLRKEAGAVVQLPKPEELTWGSARKEIRHSADREFLAAGLKEHAGNVSEFARAAKINRSYLQTLIKKHGLRAADFRKKK